MWELCQAEVRKQEGKPSLSEGGSEPSTYAITCEFQGCTSTGTWDQGQGWDSYLITQIGNSASQVESRLSNKMLDLGPYFLFGLCQLISVLNSLTFNEFLIVEDLHCPLYCFHIDLVPLFHSGLFLFCIFICSGIVWFCSHSPSCRYLLLRYNCNYKKYLKLSHSISN